MSTVNTFATRTTVQVDGRGVQIYSLPALEAAGFPEIARLPYSMKVLLENLLRHEDGRFVKSADIEALARWDVRSSAQKEISFAPARVLFVPALPKTRSAKIVRRAVRATALGQDPGDMSSVENPESLAAIADRVLA